VLSASRLASTSGYYEIKGSPPHVNMSKAHLGLSIVHPVCGPTSILYRVCSRVMCVQLALKNLRHLSICITLCSIVNIAIIGEGVQVPDPKRYSNLIRGYMTRVDDPFGVCIIPYSRCRVVQGGLGLAP
jgi:hypothetical protein